MVDFRKVHERIVKSPKLNLILQLEFNDSTLTPEEAAERIEYLINSGRSNVVSEFIIFLLKETRSSTWEFKKLEII